MKIEINITGCSDEQERLEKDFSEKSFESCIDKKNLLQAMERLKEEESEECRLAILIEMLLAHIDDSEITGMGQDLIYWANSKTEKK